MSNQNLLNLSNIPGGLISGMDDEMLDWVTKEGNERELYELSDKFLNHLNSYDVEDLPEDIENELKTIEAACIPKSTEEHMTKFSNKLKSFLSSKSLSTDFENIPKRILNNYLRYFYSELRKMDGDFYSPASLICIRAGLFRYFTSHHMQRRDINIISDPEFLTSNQMLKAMVFKVKRSNQPKREDPYPAVELQDMKKLEEYFDRSDPVKLQEEVIFSLLFYFSLRGRETIPYLTKDSLIIEEDSTGLRFIRIQCDMLAKNAKASLKKEEYESVKRQRIYEKKTDPMNCPLKAYEFYLQKLLSVQSDHLFPKPCSSTRGAWYAPKRKLGKNAIDSLMGNLSRKAHLSKRYTNHCLRVTAITILKEEGKTNEEIASFSGHKNPQSVQRYCRKRRDESLQEMSSVLQSGFNHTSLKLPKVARGGEIVVEKNLLAANEETKTNIQISFGGHFSNCSISIN